MRAASAIALAATLAVTDLLGREYHLGGLKSGLGGLVSKVAPVFRRLHGELLFEADILSIGAPADVHIPPPSIANALTTGHITVIKESSENQILAGRTASG